MRVSRWVAGTVALGLIGWALWGRSDEAVVEGEGSAHPRRAFEIAAHAPELSPEEVEGYLARSDALESTDREELARLLEEVEVGEEEVQRWYEANRALFGERSLDRARPAIHRILVYEKALAALER